MPRCCWGATSSCSSIEWPRVRPGTEGDTMRQEFRGYGVFLFILGIILLIVAGVLAGKTTVRVETHKSTENWHAEVPNTTAGLASCGFAIAAGFCFVAASLIYLGDTLARRSEA